MNTLTIKNIQEAWNRPQELSLTLNEAGVVFRRDDKPVARLAPIAGPIGGA
jgi:hypothetical protein